MTQSNCDLPDDFMCSPTLINDDCEISFNHTFKQSGKYCVNVSAVNTVGFANVLHYVDVIGIRVSNLSFMKTLESEQPAPK